MDITTIVKVLAWELLAALLVFVTYEFQLSEYLYILPFLIQLAVFSTIEKVFITLPESVKKYDYIYENGSDRNATVIDIEPTGDKTDSGQYYTFTLSLEGENAPIVIRDHVLSGWEGDVLSRSSLPIRFLPKTGAGIILFKKL